MSRVVLSCHQYGSVDYSKDQHFSHLKPNSHLTIFPTNFLIQPTIEKLVVIGRFFFSIGWYDIKIGWAKHQRFCLVKVGRFSHQRLLSSMFDKIGGYQRFLLFFFRIATFLSYFNRKLVLWTKNEQYNAFNL